MTAVDVAIIVLASLSLVRVLTRTWTASPGTAAGTPGPGAGAEPGAAAPTGQRNAGREPEPGDGPSPGHAQPAAAQDQRHHRNAGAPPPLTLADCRTCRHLCDRRSCRVLSTCHPRGASYTLSAP